MASETQAPLKKDPDGTETVSFTKPEDKDPFTRDRAQVSKTGIFLQEKCYLHRYIRNKDLSGIVERPERLRAVALGLAAALARFEEDDPTTRRGQDGRQETPPAGTDEGEQLTRAMSQLDIEPASEVTSGPCHVIVSEATCSLQSHPGVSFIHANQEAQLVDGQDYLSRLRTWAEQSEVKVSEGASEIPEHLAQGDLYLCPESIDAMSGAVATVCQAVDEVVRTKTNTNWSPRAFVAIRPPGHHCGEDTPSGFCFINNVAVGAAHAFLQHNINRIIIFDIDLHHGNGTQKIAWSLNSAAQRASLMPPESGVGLGPQIYYSSLHDILSYPCEDGNPDLVRDASISLGGAHGQYIENVHLEPYASEEDFHEDLYPQYYNRLFGQARRFVKAANAVSDNTLVFISCGFDACQHEYTYMSRHDRKVPVSFYERFAQDARLFAEEVAGGKLVSVLEGGYSDKALMSGAMAHLAGLAAAHESSGGGGASWCSARSSWWSIDNLTKLEKVLKKPKSKKPRASGVGSEPLERWLQRAQELFASMDGMPTFPARPSAAALPHRMTLRDRSKKEATPEPTPAPSPVKDATKAGPSKKPRSSVGKGRGQPKTSPPNSTRVVSKANLEPDGDLPLEVETRLGALSLDYKSSTEELVNANVGGGTPKSLGDKDNSRPGIEFERPPAPNMPVGPPKTDAMSPLNPPLMIKIKIPKTSKAEDKHDDDELKSKEGRS